MVATSEPRGTIQIQYFISRESECMCVYVYTYKYIYSDPKLPTSATENKGRVKGRLKGGILSMSLDGCPHFYPAVFQMFSPCLLQERYVQGKAETLFPLSSMQNIFLGNY